MTWQFLFSAVTSKHCTVWDCHHVNVTGFFIQHCCSAGNSNSKFPESCEEQQGAMNSLETYIFSIYFFKMQITLVSQKNHFC